MRPIQHFSWTEVIASVAYCFAACWIASLVQQHWYGTEYSPVPYTVLFVLLGLSVPWLVWRFFGATPTFRSKIGTFFPKNRT